VPGQTLLTKFPPMSFARLGAFQVCQPARSVSNLSWPESLSKKSWVMTYYKILSAVQLGAGINRLEERRG